MSHPNGVTLNAIFEFYLDGVLTDPSPLPTLVTGSMYPDGTAGPTPALTRVRAGVFTATVFTALQNVLKGTYKAWVFVSDLTLDSRYSPVQWPEVGNIESDPLAVLVPGSYGMGTAAYYLSLIGSQGMSIRTTGPMVTGKSWLIYQGFDYFAAESQQLYWDLVGWPTLVGATARFLGAGSSLPLAVNSGTNRLTLELTKVQTAALKKGVDTYGIYVIFANLHETLIGVGRIDVRPRPD